MKSVVVTVASVQHTYLKQMEYVTVTPGNVALQMLSSLGRCSCQSCC